MELPEPAQPLLPPLLRRRRRGRAGLRRLLLLLFLLALQRPELSREPREGAGTPARPIPSPPHPDIGLGQPQTAEGRHRRRHRAASGIPVLPPPGTSGFRHFRCFGYFRRVLPGAPQRAGGPGACNSPEFPKNPPNPPRVPNQAQLQL